QRRSHLPRVFVGAEKRRYAFNFSRRRRLKNTKHMHTQKKNHTDPHTPWRDFFVDRPPLRRGRHDVEERLCAGRQSWRLCHRFVSRVRIAPNVCCILLVVKSTRMRTPSNKASILDRRPFRWTRAAESGKASTRCVGLQTTVCSRVVIV